MTSSFSVLCSCRSCALLLMGMQRPSALYDFFLFSVGVSRSWEGGHSPAFRLKVFATHEGPFYAPATLPPIRRCQASGEPACQASACQKDCTERNRAPSRDSDRYLTPVTQEAWLALYALAKEKGENARPAWKNDEPPSNIHDGRATAAARLGADLGFDDLVLFLRSLTCRSLGSRERAQPPSADRN